MFKRILFLVVFFFPVITNAASFSKGILWEISSPNSKPSYLLGTMHSDDERITRLADPVQQAFEQANSFTGEVMMDMATIMTMSQMMYLTDGRQLKDIIGEQRYEQSAPYLMEYGIPEFMVGIMKPWAVATTLSLPKPKSGQFLDLMLFQKASAQGKALHGLERAEEQISVFDSMSEEDQIVMLDEALENYSQIPEMFQEFVDAYLDRDLAALQSLNKKYMKDSNPDLAEHFEKKLLVKRNYLMVERMQVRLKEGKAFIAVGALHLPGDEGVLNLLLKRKYKIRVVY